MGFECSFRFAGQAMVGVGLALLTAPSWAVDEVVPVGFMQTSPAPVITENTEFRVSGVVVCPRGLCRDGLTIQCTLDVFPSEDDPTSVAVPLDAKPIGDFDGDGAVDGSDFLIVRENFGTPAFDGVGHGGLTCATPPGQAIQSSLVIYVDDAPPGTDPPEGSARFDAYTMATGSDPRAGDTTEPGLNGIVFTVYPFVTPTTELRIQATAAAQGDRGNDRLIGNVGNDGNIPATLLFFFENEAGDSFFDTFFDITLEGGRSAEGDPGSSYWFSDSIGFSDPVPNEFDRGIAILLVDPTGTAPGLVGSDRRLKMSTYVSPTPLDEPDTSATLIFEPYVSKVTLLLPAVQSVREAAP